MHPFGLQREGGALTKSSTKVSLELVEQDHTLLKEGKTYFTMSLGPKANDWQ